MINMPISPQERHAPRGVRTTLLVLIACASVAVRLGAQADRGSPRVSNISLDVCKQITDADLKTLAPGEKLAFLPSSAVSGASFDGAIEALVGGTEADCRYTSGQTTFIVQIADFPGDKYTKGPELSGKAYQQVVKWWSPTAHPDVVQSSAPFRGLGEQGTLVTYRTGHVYIARQGPVVIAAKFEKATASSGQLNAVLPITKRLLARGVAIAATDTVESASTDAADVAPGSAKGSLSTSGAINTTWNYAPGGELDCGVKVEVPLESSTHDAAGYLDVVSINGSVTLSTGYKGMTYTGKGGHADDVKGADAPHPTQHVSVDGVLADNNGKQIKVKAAFDLVCK